MTPEPAGNLAKIRIVRDVVRDLEGECLDGLDDQTALRELARDPAVRAFVRKLVAANGSEDFLSGWRRDAGRQLGLRCLPKPPGGATL